MENLKKFQIVEFILILALILITPFLSTSHRSKYLYFIVNILIILLGAESGLLSFLHKKPIISDVSLKRDDDENQLIITPADKFVKKLPAVKILEKYSSQKNIILGGVKNRKVAVKKSPSMPSIFFIDDHMENNNNNNNNKLQVDQDYNEISHGELSGKELELFQQSETFIGNFYKQLKIQREESWKKLHGLYHKSF